MRTCKACVTEGCLSEKCLENNYLQRLTKSVPIGCTKCYKCRTCADLRDLIDKLDGCLESLVEEVTISQDTDRVFKEMFIEDLRNKLKIHKLHVDNTMRALSKA